jgi:hypothetical protein
MKSVPLVAFGIASLLSLTACGSSSPKAAPSDTASASNSTIVDVNNSAVVSGSIPVPAAATTTTEPKPLSADCIAFLKAQDAAFPEKQRTEMGDLANQYTDLASKYDQLALGAPDTLQSDFVQVSATYQTLSTLAKAAGGDINKFGSNPDALKAINDSAFTSAVANVATYIAQTCPNPKK